MFRRRYVRSPCHSLLVPLPYPVALTQLSQMLPNSSCFHTPRPHTATMSKRKFLSEGMTKEAGINQPVLQLRYGLDGRGMGVCFTAGTGIFLFSSAFIPTLGPNQPPFPCVSGDFAQSKSGRSVWLTTYFYLVSTLGRIRVISDKAIPVQPWSGPGGSKRLRFLDFKTIDIRRW